MSVRGFAVASATAVTTVGAVVGVASGSEQPPAEAAGTTAADATLLADIPAGQQAEVQTASLTQQAETASTAAMADAKKSAEEAARLKAAKDASAKKEAKEQAEREAKARAQTQQAASRSNTDAGFPVQSSYTVAEVKAMALEIVGSGQFQCFSNIVERESTWNYRATNPSSGAYGLVQAYPGSKMASVGADWRTNPATQIKWGLKYMNERYGSPCDAWEYWQVNHYY